MNKHEVAFGLAVFAATVVSLSASAGVQTVRYVKADNPGAAEPYDTEANAAGDIQTAIDFCGEDEKIVVLKGVYNTTEAVNVNKKLEVVGATGDPEDVIIHNTVSGKRCLKVTKAGAFVASMALENGSPDWENVTKGKGTGALVTAGTVSNLVVRKCVVKAAAGSGAAINAEGQQSFVTHCVVTNNTSSSGTPWNISICGIGLDLRGGARAENCLVADNRTVQQSSAWYGWGQCAAFIGDKSRMRFCTVTGNRCALFGGVGVDGTGVFESCIVAGNETFGSSLDNKDRHAVWSAFPAATTFATEGGHGGTVISDESVQSAEAEYAAGIAANQVYNAVDNEAHGLGETTVLAATGRLVLDLAEKDWHLPAGSPAIGKVPAEAVSDMAAVDVYGKPRVRDGKIDVGAAQFDASSGYVLECSVTPDAKLYAPRTATLAVVKALGFGDAPVFYWDFDGDGKADLVTTEPSVTPTFGVGVHSISVCVSNDVATFGAKYAFAEPFEVLAQPVRYVKAGNAGKEPYDSEENAAGDIQTAINFCGEEEKIIVLKGVYNTTMAVDVNKKLEVIGATGNPEDVIIHNTVSGYRCLKVTKAGAFVASMALENGKPDWDHDRNTSTRGTGAYLTAGTVSNLVVRNCTEPSAKNARGAAIDAIGANVFVTHCVISNNVSNAGAKDGFFLGANGLSVENGARAENCLIANNRGVHSSTDAWNGWGQVAVFVGNGSRMRFCTVAGNTTLLFGAIGVYGTGTFEDCIVAGNKMLEPNLDNSARHKTWCAFDAAVGHYVGPSTDVTKPNIYDAAQQSAEAEYAAGIAANQVYNAVDNEAHGLGATTVLAATDRLVRNLAKKDWQLPKGSPAIDKVPVEAAADMAALDVYGNKRLSGGIYDIGCHERLVPGLMLLVR